MQQNDPEVIARVAPIGMVPLLTVTKPRKATRHWLVTVADRLPMLNAQARANTLAIAEALVESITENSTSRPTWAGLEAATGLSRRTVARVLARLREIGLLAVVATGRSARYAGSSNGEDGQNDAAVYVLCAPKPGRPEVEHSAGVDKVGTLQRNSSFRRSPIARARSARGKTDSLIDALGLADVTFSGVKQLGKRKLALLRRRHMAMRLRSRIPDLRRISTKAVAAVISDFVAAGWSLDDLHHALDWKPEGTRWTYGGPVRSPIGWLTYRLGAWRDVGQPIASRSQQREARRAAELARRVWEAYPANQCPEHDWQHRPCPACNAEHLAGYHRDTHHDACISCSRSGLRGNINDQMGFRQRSIP